MVMVLLQLKKYIEHYPEERGTININGTVLVESTATNLKNGNPGKQYMKQAIENQMDIVAISKGALVTAWSELNTAARISGQRIRYSGATAAALPTLDIGQLSLAGCHIEKIEGILTGQQIIFLQRCMKNIRRLKKHCKKHKIKELRRLTRY